MARTKAPAASHAFIEITVGKPKSMMAWPVGAWSRP